MTRLEAAIGVWVVQHRWWTIAVTTLVVLSAGSGMRFLTVNNDTRVFVSEDNPQLAALETLESTYTKGTGVIFALTPEEGDVFSRETLTAIEELPEASWTIPYSSRVNSLNNFQHTVANEDELIVENLVRNASALSDSDLQQIRQIALSEPELLNRILSITGTVTSVRVEVLLPGESMA